MLSARMILQQLSACGITHVVTLPDNASNGLLRALAPERGIRTVSVTREGEAWAVAAGLWIGGRTPAVLIQNTGFLESGDALRGTVMRMRVPVLCLLTYRGCATLERLGPRPGVPLDGRILSRADVDSCAVLFEPTLRAWGIPYDFLRDDLDAPKIRAAFEQAQQREHPAAVLITRDVT